MDYEEAYKKALERARQFSEHPLQEDSGTIVEYIFPELKENREERIVKELLNMVVSMPDNKWHEYSIDKEEAIEWLNKNYPRCIYKSTSVSTSNITTTTTKISEDECHAIN